MITHVHRGFKETAKYWVQTDLAGLWTFLLNTIEPVQYLLNTTCENERELMQSSNAGGFLENTTNMSVLHFPDEQFHEASPFPQK